MPQYHFTEVYQLHAWLMLKFLAKLEYKTHKKNVYFDDTLACKKVAELEK